MNLINRYINEVGKHLPRKGRADIEAEIRSTLEEMLEERKQARPESDRRAGASDEAAVIELLKEYGEPRKVAESYTGPRYLIGPRMYPTFELVTRIVLTVLFAVALAGLGIGLSRSGLNRHHRLPHRSGADDPSPCKKQSLVNVSGRQIAAAQTEQADE